MEIKIEHIVYPCIYIFIFSQFHRFLYVVPPPQRWLAVTSYPYCYFYYGAFFFLSTEMTQSPLTSPVVERRPIPTNIFNDPHLQQGLAKIKHEQELQHQLLIQHYQQQQHQLAQEHEKQLQDHIKV